MSSMILVNLHGIAPAELKVVGVLHRPSVQADGRCLGCGLQAVNVASFVLSESIVGLMISATPGIASTLSSSWLSAGMTGVTNPASVLRCVSDNCPTIPLTLSI